MILGVYRQTRPENEFIYRPYIGLGNLGKVSVHAFTKFQWLPCVVFGCVRIRGGIYPVHIYSNTALYRYHCSYSDTALVTSCLPGYRLTLPRCWCVEIADSLT